jgi:hypothetical protein
MFYQVAGQLWQVGGGLVAGFFSFLSIFCSAVGLSIRQIKYWRAKSRALKLLHQPSSCLEIKGKKRRRKENGALHRNLNTDAKGGRAHSGSHSKYDHRMLPLHCEIIGSASIILEVLFFTGYLWQIPTGCEELLVCLGHIK